MPGKSYQSMEGFKSVDEKGKGTREFWGIAILFCVGYFKPNRQFPQDWKQYRRKSRGLDRHTPRRKPKATFLRPPEPEIFNKPQILKNSKGRVFLLR
jgi:hypothetical protein